MLDPFAGRRSLSVELYLCGTASLEDCHEVVEKISLYACNSWIVCRCTAGRRSLQETSGASCLCLYGRGSGAGGDKGTQEKPGARPRGRECVARDNYFDGNRGSLSGQG